MLKRVAYRTNTVDTGGDLPSEFLLFKPGWNDSTKGAVLFDERAAELVMAAYHEHGTDLMIDLEHQSLLSLEDAARARADACDARGWFSLDLRPDGSLWAIVKSWTPDGERRLREKTQRYISPAFWTDEEGRVTEIINCAIVAMPATHGAEALVAASARLSRLGRAARLAALQFRCQALSPRPGKNHANGATSRKYK